MERDDEPTTPQATPDQGGALKTPEPPDQEALPREPGDAEGPFGADMQTLLGGTRAAPDHQNPEHAASAYSTGTDAGSGTSLSAKDPRSTTGEDGKEETGAEDMGTPPTPI